MDTEKLRLLRRKRGWTQSEMAERIGIARTYYNSIERGKICAGFATLLKIASVLKVKLSTLVKE